MRKYSIFNFILTALLLMIIAPITNAAIRLPSIFSDHMVLQRNKPVAVWGWGSTGEKVTVSINGQEATTTAGKNGKWMLKLKPMPAGGPYNMIIKGHNTITLSDILIGEVWLCSGQSNMEFGIKLAKNADDEISSANHPKLRLFYVPKAVSAKEREKLPKDCEWRICTPATILKGSHKSGFSATAYFFGRKIYQELKIPVGLIQAAVGSIKIEPFTPKEGFDQMPELQSVKNSLKRIEQQQDRIASKFHHPAAAYNAMIHPLVPFSVRGVIWYQGESNYHDSVLYVFKKKALINSWRDKWHDEFPFYFVQIAPYIKPGDTYPYHYPEFWEAQTDCLKINKTGMVVINDIGHNHDIHPANKQDIAERLAASALTNTYKKNMGICRGPMFKSMHKDGNSIIVKFNYTGSGLKSRNGDSLNWFEIAGKEGKFVKAKAVIEGHRVRVSSTEVVKPHYVRFAWYCSARPNLINKEGWPAAPFRYPRPQNIAFGKPYYCSDGRKMTSGPLTDGSWLIHGWPSFSIKFNPVKPTHVTIDLKKNYPISQINLGVPIFGYTKTVIASYSTDGKNFKQLKEFTFKQGKLQVANIKVDDIIARYIRISFKNCYQKKIRFPIGSLFLREVEVISSADMPIP